MTPLRMVEKLLVVTQDPFEIWRAFEDFQPGFFITVIMKEYSIGDNFAAKVLDDFKGEVEKYALAFE
jgi:hypothetical protein